MTEREHLEPIENPMAAIEELLAAIAHIEAQRAVLGDAVVEMALASMQEKLAVLQQDLDTERDTASLRECRTPSPAAQKDALEQQAPVPILRWPQRKPPPQDSALAGERKLVTVMFAGITGFAILTETMDPESVRDLMNACFDRLVPIIEKYEGTLDKLIGGDIMALFGAPLTHENDPERALRAALEMLDTLDTFNMEQGTDLFLRFGINTGLVVAGGIGTHARQEYSVMGAAVNVAKRLEEASQQGDILVGPNTFQLTAPLFDFEALEPIVVKGKHEPQPVHRLLQTKKQPERIRGLKVWGIHSPLVGRSAELAAFTRCIDRLSTGQGGIVFIVGGAGIGKSRLATQARQEIPEQITWIEGRSLSFGRTISYWPFQEILRQDIGITEDDDETIAWAKLETRIATLFPDQVDEILPYLASLLILPVRGKARERVKYLDGESLKHQIFLTSRRFFERLAQEQPLVLVFDDLHWTDASSVALLEHLLPLVERAPILICGIGRPDHEAPAAQLQAVASQNHAGCYTEISLAPLSQANTAQLVHNLLDIEDISPRVQGIILRKAEGNPFFVEEVVRTLIDLGIVALDPATGRWRATTYVEQIAIPDTIQGVIIARIDRLEEEVKHVLRMASVIGRRFLHRVLQAIAEADRDLDQHLDDLEQIELVRKSRRIPELEYMFKHALAQEATYESVLLRRRRELHAQVGACIEELFADRLDEFYGPLAYHYARAENWEKAQAYLFKVGDQSGKVAADAEALTHYQQAVAAYTRAFGDRWDPFQRAVLERKMGEILFRRGEYQEAHEYLLRALTYLDKPFPTSRWSVRLAIVWQLVRQVGHRLLPRLFLRKMARQIDPVLKEHLYIYEIMSWMDYYLDQERMVLDIIWLLNLAEGNGFPFGILRGSMGLGLMCDFMGMPGIARSYHRRAKTLADQLEHPGAIGSCYFGLAFHRVYLGQWDETTIQYLQRAIEAVWGMGNLREWGNFVIFLYGVQYMFKGDFTSALKRFQEVIPIAQDGGDLHLLAWGTHGLGRIGQYVGALDEAIVHLQKAIDLYKTIPDYPGQTDAGGHLGLCYLRQGKLERALAVLEESNQLVAAQGLRGHQVVPTRNGLAQAYLVAAEQANGPARTRWLKKAGRACRAALREGKVFCGGLPHAMRLQGRYEWLRGKPRAAQKWWQRSLAISKPQGARYEQGMTLLEKGKWLGERAILEQAEQIFVEIDAQLDLARVRELLRKGPAYPPRTSSGR